MSTMWFLHLLSWLLVSDSFTSVVSYHRHTGFVLTLPMPTRLKFLNLVLPTVTSWLVIWVHLFVFLERKRWLGQCISNNERSLKGSSFSVVESWLWLTCRACPTLSMHGFPTTLLAGSSRVTKPHQQELGVPVLLMTEVLCLTEGEFLK